MAFSINYRPFYETVVIALRTVRDEERFDMLALLLQATEIIKNHDAIVMAYLEALARLRLNDNLCIVEIILEQKREAEAKAAEMAKRDEAMLREQVRREERLMQEIAADAREDCN